MPQLNLSPWLGIALFAWTVLLVFIPQNVMMHLPFNHPSYDLTNRRVKHDEHDTLALNWTWTWY